MPLAKQVILFVIDGLPIAYLLGLPTPVEWSGRVVTEVLAL